MYRPCDNQCFQLWSIKSGCEDAEVDEYFESLIFEVRNGPFAFCFVSRTEDYLGFNALSLKNHFDNSAVFCTCRENQNRILVWVLETDFDFIDELAVPVGVDDGGIGYFFQVFSLQSFGAAIVRD